MYIYMCVCVYIHIRGASGKRNGDGGKSKREEALEKRKRRERVSSIQGLGRAEFRVTKVISLFVRKVSPDRYEIDGGGGSGRG